jgi:hypothetical protein
LPQQLVDDFSGASMDATKWRTATCLTEAYTTGATFTQPGGVLDASVAGNDSYTSIATYDMTGGTESIKIATVGPRDASLAFGNINNWSRAIIESGTLYFQVSEAGARTTVASVAWDSATMAWLRIAHVTTGDAIQWYTSPDGAVWTQRASRARGFNIKAVNMAIEVVSVGGTGVDNQYDNFNFTGQPDVVVLLGQAIL